MASKRRVRRTGCGKKRRLNQQEAQRLAAILNDKQGHAHHVDAYRCKFDPSHWHVGHRPKKVQFAISSRRRQAT